MTDTIAEPGAAGAAPATLLRVSVRSGTSRVDVAVPGGVAVAELLPDLAAEVGVLDVTTVYAGYRLVRGDGAELCPDEGLTAQGIVDGDTLVIAVGADDEHERVYDDVVEAVADTVQAGWKSWDARAARWTALITAAAMLLLGAIALGLARDEGVPVLAGGAVAAVALLVAAGYLARARNEHEVAAAAACLAVPYAAAAGLAVLEDDPVLRLPMALAGAGGFLVAAIGLLLLTRTRFALLPALVTGAAAGACGGVLDAIDDAKPGVAISVVLVLAVIVGVLLPMFAVSNTGLQAPSPQTTQDLTADAEPYVRQDVEQRIRIGREVLLALSATVALLVVVSTPFAVDLGIGGAALAGCAAAALLLRTRQFHSWGEVAVGVGGGVGGFIALVISASVLHPDWRPAIAVLGAVAGLAVIALTLSPNRPPLRLARAADVAENGTLLALMPLLAVASGLVELVNR